MRLDCCYVFANITDRSTLIKLLIILCMTNLMLKFDFVSLNNNKSGHSTKIRVKFLLKHNTSCVNLNHLVFKQTMSFKNNDIIIILF